MKKFRLLKTVVTILCVTTSATFSFGQLVGPSSPEINTLMQFESNPVSLHTGLPNIGIPIYNMPTLRDGFSIPVGLNYHTLSLTAYDSISGNCGRGWNLSTGGAISRELSGPMSNSAITNQGGAYYFNFLGYKGKFSLRKDPSWIAYVSENSGAPLSITVNQPLGVFTSIIIHDTKGLHYHFTLEESFIFVKSIFHPFVVGADFRIPFKNAFRLTSITSSGVTLATFSYDTYNPTESYYTGAEESVQRVLKEINVPGYGKMEFTYDYDSYEKSVRYNQVVVKDFKNTAVKKFKFNYTDNNLTQVDESDFAETKVLSYKMDYKAAPSAIVFLRNRLGIDNWGYPNIFLAGQFNSSDKSQSRYATANYASKGALEKMTLPTGGCFIYQYELNTYSYHLGTPLEELDEIDGATCFTRFNVDNMHNYTTTQIATATLSTINTSKTFTPVAGTTTTIEIYGFGGVNPGFTLKQGAATVATFTGNPNAYRSFTLTGGLPYTLIHSSYGVASNVIISAQSLNANPRKEHRGNGIRIKRIGYFTDGTVSQNYYDLTGHTIFPVKETNYDYSLLSDPLRSSGSISELATVDDNNNPTTRNKPIYYKNVTVTDSGNNGRTTYDFTSPIDEPVVPGSGVPIKEYTFGKLNQQKIYNQAGTLLNSVLYEYDFHVTDTIYMTLNDPTRIIGFAAPKQINDKTWYTSPHVIDKQINFSYDVPKQRLTTTVETSSENTDTKTKKYFYFDPVTLGDIYRTGDVERLEEYFNAELTYTAKTNFSRTWPAITENGVTTAANPNWWPLSVDVTKGANTAKTKVKNNIYDAYNHILESEQPNGMKTVYVWGYNHSQIVAKIENISYSAMSVTAVTNLTNIVRTKSDTGTEAELLTALTNLRNASQLSGAMVTTFTYKPLVGVSTVTDVKGFRTTYEYDVLNRLKAVRDHKGKILSENEYHYLTEL